MIAAFTVWNGRIAPVFDVAGQAVLVDSELHDKAHTIITLPEGSPQEKLSFLQQQQVEVVICGAMTRYTSRYAQGMGIEVFPFIAGEQQEVITSWLNKRLQDNKFSMPGCGCNGCFRRNQRGRHNRGGCGR